MSGISTHVLDTSLGRPAGGVKVVLEKHSMDTWVTVGEGTTDKDGRVKSLLPSGKKPAKGMYRLKFDTLRYFSAQQRETFYPQITVTFFVTDPAEACHVPVLLSPYGYATYRGS